MKKAFVGLLICVMMFLGVTNVSAKMLTLSEVANKFNELNVTFDNDICKGKVTAVAESGVLSMQCSGNEIFVFVYGANELSYMNPGTSGTIHQNSDALFKLIDGILESVLIQSGYEKISLDSNIDTDGLYLNTEEIVTTEAIPFYREGMALGKKVLVKRLDLSLDTSKIDNVVREYGDPYIRKILEVKPSLSAKNITSSSIDLYPKVENTPSDTSYKASCYLYRSTEENGEYALVATLENCLTGVKLSEKNLTDDTTYFYKMQIVGSRNISDPISVVTLEKGVTPPPVEPDPSDPDPGESKPTPNPGTDPDKKNPDTGAFVPVVVLGIFMVGGISTIVYTNKKNRFKNY